MPQVLPDPKEWHTTHPGLGAGEGGKLEKSHGLVAVKGDLDRTGVPYGLVSSLLEITGAVKGEQVGMDGQPGVPPGSAVKIFLPRPLDGPKPDRGRFGP